MKKLILTLLLLFCLLPAQALADEIPVFNANGQKLPLNPSACTADNTALLPLRSVAEYLGAEVAWQPSGEITVSKDGCQIILTVGQSSAQKISGGQTETFQLSAPPHYLENTLFVPLRFVAEALDIPVNYCVNQQDDFKVPVIILGESQYAENYEYANLPRHEAISNEATGNEAAGSEMLEQLRQEITGGGVYTWDEVNDITSSYVSTVMGIDAEAYNLNNFTEETLAYMDFFISENVKQSSEWRQYLALAKHQHSEISADPLKITVTEDKISGTFGFQLSQVLFFIPLLADVEITRQDGALSKQAPAGGSWSYLEKDPNGYAWFVTKVSNPRAYLNLQALRANEPEIYARWTAYANLAEIVYQEEIEADAKAAAQKEADLNGNDLAAARNAALSLPTVETMEKFKPAGENISHTTYYFPYGESKRFIVETLDTLYYYEVREGSAHLVWQGKLNAENKVMQEAGQRPDFGGKQAYFDDFFQADAVSYGIIENGLRRQAEEIKNISAQSPDGDWQKRIIVHNIDGESKQD